MTFPRSQANSVLRSIAGLSHGQKIEVLAEAMQLVCREGKRPALTPEEMREVQSRSSLSKIDADEEMKAFVLAQPEPLTLKSLHAALVERFGRDRAPSKSSVHRYLTRIAKR